MADLLTANQSFVGNVNGQTLDVRKGDLFEADHPAVEKWPEMFGPVSLRFPVQRTRVEKATAAPGEKRGR